MEKLFKLKEYGTDVRTEVLAGITTFMTMAYILAINPSMLSAAGMDATAVLIATCLSAFFGTMCMALFANYPFALAPGLGLNAYFAYTVCLGMGYDWRVALSAVAVEGIIFIVLYILFPWAASVVPAALYGSMRNKAGFFIASPATQAGTARGQRLGAFYFPVPSIH